MTFEQVIPNLSIFAFFVCAFWFLMLSIFLSRKQLILPFCLFSVFSIYLFISNSSYGRYVNDISELPDDNYTIVTVDFDVAGAVPMVLLPDGTDYYRYFVIHMSQQQKEELKKEFDKESKGGAAEGNMRIVRKGSGWSIELSDKYKVPKSYNEKRNEN